MQTRRTVSPVCPSTRASSMPTALLRGRLFSLGFLVIGLLFSLGRLLLRECSCLIGLGRKRVSGLLVGRKGSRRRSGNRRLLARHYRQFFGRREKDDALVEIPAGKLGITYRSPVSFGDLVRARLEMYPTAEDKRRNTFA